MTAITPTLTREEIIEDAEWMASTGETWPGACKRLGYRSQGLRDLLDKAGRGDIVAALRQNGTWLTGPDKPRRQTWAQQNRDWVDELKAEHTKARVMFPDPPEVIRRRLLTLILET